MDDDDGYRFSFPVGVPLVLAPVLAVVAGSTAWWGALATGVAALLAAVFAWEAFSRREYEIIRAKDASMNLATWRLNWLMFFVLPFALAAIWGGWRWLRG